MSECGCRCGGMEWLIGCMEVCKNMGEEVFVFYGSETVVDNLYMHECVYCV